MVERLTLFVYRVFDTEEDFRLPRAASTLVKAAQSMKHDDWIGLLHVTTSPDPRAGKVNPDILRNGLVPVGSHVIPQDIWDQMVPPDFYGRGLRDFDVEAVWIDARGNDRPSAPPPPPPWVSEDVSNFVSVPQRQWLLFILSEDLPPTCWPFIIPKTSEKVSLILSCVKQNGLDGCNPRDFRSGLGSS